MEDAIDIESCGLDPPVNNAVKKLDRMIDHESEASNCPKISIYLAF